MPLQQVLGALGIQSDSPIDIGLQPRPDQQVALLQPEVKDLLGRHFTHELFRTGDVGFHQRGEPRANAAAIASHQHSVAGDEPQNQQGHHSDRSPAAIPREGHRVDRVLLGERPAVPQLGIQRNHHTTQEGSHRKLMCSTGRQSHNTHPRQNPFPGDPPEVQQHHQHSQTTEHQPGPCKHIPKGTELQ